jgi:hypothetical protein
MMGRDSRLAPCYNAGMSEPQKRQPIWLFPACFLVPYLLLEFGRPIVTGAHSDYRWVALVCGWAIICWIVSLVLFRDRYFPRNQ